MTEQNQQNSLLGKIAAYTEILAKDPKSTIFVSLGEAYRKMGMLDDARQVIEKGLGASPDFSPAHIVLGRILCQQGEYQASESAFQSALEGDPESLAALVGYARLNILIGNENKARDVLLKARELSPADPIINKLLLSLPEPEPQEPILAPVAEAESPEGEDSSVIEAETAPESKEAPPLISTTLAELYLKQGLTDQALEVYRQLSAVEPDNLLFRRKIRDLEGGISGEDESAEEERLKAVAEAEAVECKEGEEGSFQVETEPGSDQQAPEVAGDNYLASEEGEASVDERAVATLNRWLDSIQKRREDV